MIIYPEFPTARPNSFEFWTCYSLLIFDVTEIAKEKILVVLEVGFSLRRHQVTPLTTGKVFFDIYDQGYISIFFQNKMKKK